MTEPEFKVFLRHHAANFRTVAKTFNEAPNQGSETREAWFRVLRHLALEDAIQASDSMLEGGTQPTFDRHPSRIRQLVAESKSKEESRYTSSGEVTFACPHCQDTGYVEIDWDQEYRDRIVEAYGPEVTARMLQSQWVTCSCKSHGPGAFKPERHR